MATKSRSPNFPALSLPVAVERARAFYDEEGKAAVPVSSAVKVWGYNSMNGRSLRVVAALNQYGLIEYPAKGTVKLTTRALNILLQPAESAVRIEALQSAAHEPAVFGQLLDQYPDGMPSDRSMIASLTAMGSFNEQSATLLISVFRDTMALAHGDAEADISALAPNPDVQIIGRTAVSATVTRKDREMPMLVSTGQGSAPYDLTLALMDGVQATLRIPRQMTEDNYALLTSLLEANLKAMKKALVPSSPVLEEPSP